MHGDPLLNGETSGVATAIVQEMRILQSGAYVIIRQIIVYCGGVMNLLIKFHKMYNDTINKVRYTVIFFCMNR